MDKNIQHESYPYAKKAGDINKSHKKLIGVTLVIVLLIIGSFFYFRKAAMSPNQSKKLIQNIAPTPTPMPFEELTIPALRKKIYKSELGPLEQVSANNLYRSYKTSYMSEGLKIYGQITIPQEDMPIEGWRAIIFIHGYIPPSSYQTFQNYSTYVDYLARNGFVVFKIDLRGHGESEGEPGGGYYAADYVTDALNARAALQAADFVNPAKIGLWGHSMAGNIVLRSMAVNTDIPAGVTWGGAVFTYEDWKKYGIDDGSYRPPANAVNTQRRRQRLTETYGEFDPTDPFWSKFAPTNYLKDIKGAIQLNHTVDDPVVDIGYSRDLNSLLNTAKVTHELNEYPTGGHNFTGSAFTQAMQNTVEFFNKNL